MGDFEKHDWVPWWHIVVWAVLVFGVFAAIIHLMEQDVNLPVEITFQSGV